jgi:hypothetical protein
MAYFVSPRQSEPNLNGAVSAGSTYEFYEAGTTTPKTVYSDAAETVPLGTVVTSDSAGRFPTIFISDIFKVVFKDSDGVEIYTQDNINAADFSAAATAAAAARASEEAAALSETAAADSETAAGVSETNAAASEVAAALSEANAAGSEANASASELAAEAAAQIAAMGSDQLYASTADALSKGVYSLTSLVGGTGGTNGTFALAFSGGAGTNAAGVFTVAGGIVVSYEITSRGRGYTSAPTVSFAASAGLSGASATAVIAVNRAVGQYFGVPVSGSTDSMILYRVDTGPTAAEITRYTSSAAVDAIGDRIPSVAPPGYAWSVMDGAGKAAIGVKDDGTFEAKEIEAGAVNSAINSADEFEVKDAGGTAAGTIKKRAYPGYAFVLEDENFNAAIGIKDDGTLDVKDLEVANINGAPYVAGGGASSGIVALRGGTYSHQVNYINNAGQSLGEGSTPATAITTTQEYDNKGFPARSVAPVSFVDLTVANTQQASRGESPMYGTLGHIKELIANEQGISYTDNEYQLVACNNAYSGQSITTMNQGTTIYDTAITQVQAAYDIAIAAGKTMAFQAVTWTQGEADASMDGATYKGHLKQLAEDYNTDGKAITGQFNDVSFITYQTATVNKNIAKAQLEASNESGLISMACPMYQFEYGDDKHITAESSKWLGGYYGLVYKRAVVDRKEWKPLQPVGHAIAGDTIDLIFNRTGLVLDTTLIPAQTDSGFEVRDAASGVISISSVEVVAPNRIRLTLASTPGAGWSIRYGYNSATGKSPFVGGCGNLRDSQGDRIIYSAISKPMHNWCVIFNYSI